jgi:hypothetical protein
MASGWEAVGGVLGGGIDRAGAFEQGRLRTAQTENAILQAQERQLRNIAAETRAATEERVRRTEAEQGIDKVPLADIMGAGYGNYDQVMSGRLKGQEHGFRGTLANPEASGTDRFLAAQGVQGKVLNPFDMVGQAEFADLRNPDAGLNTTALGESLIDENVAQTAAANALADQRARAPAAGGAPGAPGEPPRGYILNPDYDSSQPIGEGNYPYLDARQPVMGARESAFFNRVYGSAVAMERDLSNLMQMPFGTSIGVLGVGPAAQHGTPSPAALSGALKYQLSEPETQAYNASLGGMNRALSFIEGQGLVGSNTIAESYDTLLLRPGESLEMAMYKMAQMKQTVEAGLAPHISNPRVPMEQKKAIRELMDRLDASIPFEVEDVIALQFGKARSLREATEQRLQREGAGAGIGAPPPAAAPPAPVADEVWERGPDGKLRRVQ